MTSLEVIEYIANPILAAVEARDELNALVCGRSINQ
jgi:hypothetical protein